MRRTLTAVTVAVSLTLAAGAGPASAQTAPNQRVSITFVGGYTGVAVATGVINAVGVAQEQSTLSPDGSFVGTLTFRFALGTVVAPFTGQVTSVTVDPRTCTGRFTSVGSFTIASATGAYAGMSGHGSFTEEGMFNSLRTANGCNPEPFIRTLLRTEATAVVAL